MNPRPRLGDSDYADGMEAWDSKNWEGVITAMQKIIARRPGTTMLGPDLASLTENSGDTMTLLTKNGGIRNRSFIEIFPT